MKNDKQAVEEMAHDMCEYYYEGTCYQDKKPCDLRCESMTDAQYLYAKGYRKVSQEGAECPTCHGTGRIGTTDWLTKGISKEQLAKEKAEAITEFAKELTSELIKGGIYPVFVKGAIERTAKKLKGETDGKSDL